MTKTVLVTGGLGYLGGRICHYLSAESNIRLTTSRAEANVPDWASAMDIRYLDLRHNNAEKTSAVMDGVDAVVHLAALNAQQCAKDPADAIEVNVGGTQALVSAAIESGIDRFIYISTAHVYGAPLSGRIDETVRPSPKHPYALTHQAAEEIVLGAKGLDGVVLRLSNAIGAPMDEGVNCWMLAGPDLCRQAVTRNTLTLSGDGTEFRDFICMSDVVRVIAHVLQRSSHELGDGLFNVGQGNSISIKSLAETIVAIAKPITGSRPEIMLSGSGSIETNELLFYVNEKIGATGFSVTGDLKSELMDVLIFCSERYGVQ